MLLVLITGGAGQLGHAFGRSLPSRHLLADRHLLDLAQPQQIASVIATQRPSVVINCGAYKQVDQAEREPEACHAINATAVEHLALACNRIQATLVQISTDYLFGVAPAVRRPWREDDAPAPQSVYAHSKLAGEEAARLAEKHLIIRTCGLYGGGPRHVSFVEKMLQLAQQRKELKIVADQHCTPSLVDDVAQAVLLLVANNQQGTFHITNTGHTTWLDFAAEVFRVSQIDMHLEPTTTAAFGAPASRPPYSVLDTGKYHSLQLGHLRPWQAALADYLLNCRAARSS